MVNSKLRRHKVMERAIKAVMSGNLPPKFKYKDTYDSIEFPTGYTLPSRQAIEDKFDELLAEEEAEPKTSILGDLEVGTANLYVDTMTSNVGVGTETPAYKFDVVGNVRATYFIGDGTLLSNVVNDTDLQSNVTTLREDLQSNVTALREDLQSNVTTLETQLTSVLARLDALENTPS